MAYSSLTDFMALLRQTAGGVRMERMPGLDYIVAALARASMFAVSVSATEPAANKPTTVWVRPNSAGSAYGEATVFLWDPSAAAYAAATPALWTALFGASAVAITVARLPAAGTAGRRLFVTDANATAFNSVVAGGGANKVPVFDDGANWRIG